MKKDILLFLNTAQREYFEVCLFKEKKTICYFKGEQKGEDLLEKVARIFNQFKLKIKALKGIIVTVGPGSFTGIRIGLTLANTLGYLLKIPVVGLKTSEFKTPKQALNLGYKKLKGPSFVKPFYGKEPNITFPKTKI